MLNIWKNVYLYSKLKRRKKIVSSHIIAVEGLQQYLKQKSKVASHLHWNICKEYAVPVKEK